MTDQTGAGMEARKVSHLSFGIAMTAFGLVIGGLQWEIIQLDKRVAVAEAEAKIAVTSVTDLNYRLSVQLRELQVDVQWIKLKMEELGRQRR